MSKSSSGLTGATIRSTGMDGKKKEWILENRHGTMEGFPSLDHLDWHEVLMLRKQAISDDDYDFVKFIDKELALRMKTKTVPSTSASEIREMIETKEEKQDTENLEKGQIVDKII